MDDPEFRKAMAFAINVDEIVQASTATSSRPANPTGLLPIWDKYVDQAVVDELGFTYDPDRREDDPGRRRLRGHGR